MGKGDHLDSSARVSRKVVWRSGTLTGSCRSPQFGVLCHLCLFVYIFYQAYACNRRNSSSSSSTTCRVYGKKQRTRNKKKSRSHQPTPITPGNRPLLKLTTSTFFDHQIPITTSPNFHPLAISKIISQSSLHIVAQAAEIASPLEGGVCRVP